MEKYEKESKGTMEHGGIMEGAQEKVRETMKNVSAEVQGRVEAAKEAFEELREKDWSEIFEDAQDVVRRHPVISIAGALFVGYSVGRLIAGRD